MSAVLKLSSTTLRVAHKQLFTANRLLCKISTIITKLPINSFRSLSISDPAVQSFNSLARQPIEINQKGFLAPIYNKRFSSNQDNGGNKQGSSNGKWIFLALLLSGAGAAGIAQQYGYFDKATEKTIEKKKSKPRTR